MTIGRVRSFKCHRLRHFGASTRDGARVDPGAIQRILSHERRTTTEIYLHFIGEAERAAMDVFEWEFEKPQAFFYIYKG